MDSPNSPYLHPTATLKWLTLIFLITIGTANAQLPSVKRVAISKGDTFWILEDGSLWASGANGGMHGDGTTNRKQFAQKVVNSNVADVAIGQNHSLVLKENGSLWGAGFSRMGELGLGAVEFQSYFEEIVPSGVIAIHANWQRSYFIMEDGSLWGMGIVEKGSNETISYVPTQIVASGVSDVAAGFHHTLILFEDSSLWGTGSGDCGALGYIGGDLDVLYSPTMIIDSGVIDIAAGEEHSVILKEDGSVWTAGTCESEDELGNPSSSSHSVFTQVATDATAVFAGPNITMFIKNDGSVWDTNGPDAFNLIFESNGIGVVSSFDGSSFSSSIILNSDGTVWGIGNNDPGVFGSPYEGEFFDTAVQLSIPAAPIANAGPDILLVDQDESGNESAFLDSSWSYTANTAPYEWLWEWPGGSSDSAAISAQFPIGETTATLTVTDEYNRSSTDAMKIRVEPALSNTLSEPLFIVKAAAGGGNIMLVLNDGSLWGRGSNALGALGNGTYSETLHWNRLRTSGVADIATYTHSLQLHADGSVYASGDNDFGQLGNNSTSNTSTPIPVYSSGISKIDISANNSLILKDDGSVWTMGMIAGTGLDPQSLLTPTQLFDPDVIDIATGSNNRFALKSDGSAWGSGANQYGILGYNDGDTPGQIFPGGITSIRSGFFHALFLQDDGSVLGLGRSNLGQLGIRGNYTYSPDPIVVFDKDVVSIEAASTMSFVIKSDGSLWVAGRDSRGGLGTGSSRSVTEFRKIMDSGVKSVSAGAPTVVLKEDGSLWGMGGNFGGPLGPTSQLGERVLSPVELLGPSGQIQAQAGVDIKIADFDNNGVETVVLDATNSQAPWNIQSWRWSWIGGQAEGSKALGTFPVGTTTVLLEATSIDESVSIDSVMVTVLPSKSDSSEFKLWLESHFSEETIDSWIIDAAFMDPDEDGLSNLDEWLTNLDPTDSTSNFRVTSSNSEGPIVLSINPALSEYSYTLWSSPDLSVWEATVPLSMIETEQSLLLELDPSDGPFFKVAASPIENP